MIVNFLKNRGAFLILLSLAMLLTSPVSASVLAAKVLLTKGRVFAVNEAGAIRSLARRSNIFVGDHIKTGVKSLVQLRFVDEARMTLRGNTDFFIKDYVYNEAKKPNKALMRLITGGFRTITGAIGKGNKSAYKVETSVASIGIRGTHYEVVEESPNVFVMAVWKGGIVVRNKFATLNLGGDVAFRYSRVERGHAPVGLLVPPASLVLPTVEKESLIRHHRRFEKEREKEKNKDKDKTEIKNEVAIKDEESKTHTRLQKNNSMAIEKEVKTNDSNAKYEFTESNPSIQSKLQAIYGIGGGKLPYGPDKRLTRFEGQQILDNKVHLAGAVPIGLVVQSGLVTAPKPVVGFDFSTSGAARFSLLYTVMVANASPINKTISVILNKNDQTVSALAADINDQLVLAGVDLRAQDSAISPGHLEFSTNISNRQVNMAITSNTFTVLGNTRVQDVASALGLVPLPGTSASSGFMYVLAGTGGLANPQMYRGAAVFDSSNEPVFLIPGSNVNGIGINQSASSFPAPVNVSLIGQIPISVLKEGKVVNSQQNLHVGGLANVSWGRWNASATTPSYRYNDKTHPATFIKDTGPFYWFTAEAAPTASLTGTATFISTGDVFGVMPDGKVKQISASFLVNFNSPVTQQSSTPNITNGSFSVTSVGNTTWKVGFNGYYQKGQADMFTTSGSGKIINSSGQNICSASPCVDGRLGGIFVAPTGAHFVGGFSLKSNTNASGQAQGVFLMKRQ